MRLSAGDMLAQIVRADIHQLDGIQRAAAEDAARRRHGRRGRECKIHARIGERQRLIVTRVIAAGCQVMAIIASSNAPASHHERLGRAAFLRGQP